MGAPRVVVVTGAASGIGKATAARLEAEGMRVVRIDRSAAIAETPDGHCMDVGSEEDWVRTVAAVLASHGRIDGLVNAAGIIRMGTVCDTGIEDLRLTLRVNVEGPFLGMKHVMPVMKANGGGSVVNISSTAGIAGAPGAAAYCASKGAVRLLTKSAALEALADKSNIRVNSLHPAMTETPMVTEIVRQLGGDGAIEQAMRDLQPSGAFIPVNAVVDAIVFLLSDASAYMNGTEFVVDNGFTAQ